MDPFNLSTARAQVTEISTRRCY